MSTNRPPRSPISEPGFLVTANRPLGRSADHNVAVLIRSVVAYTFAIETEMTFVAQGTHSGEWWTDAFSAASDGVRVGFAFTDTMPSL
ncbi:MAG: hypothetical protein ACREN5_08690, partial [Gemmatimonadales bacterium]